MQEGLAEAGQPAGVLGAFHIRMRDRLIRTVPELHPIKLRHLSRNLQMLNLMINLLSIGLHQILLLHRRHILRITTILNKLNHLLLMLRKHIESILQRIVILIFVKKVCELIRGQTLPYLLVFFIHINNVDIRVFLCEFVDY